MLHMNINLQGDGAWPDLATKEVIRATSISLSALAGGLVSGGTAVGIRIDLPDGRVVLAETSLKLFLSGADALRARYGDPRFP